MASGWQEQRVHTIEMADSRCFRRRRIRASRWRRLRSQHMSPWDRLSLLEPGDRARHGPLARHRGPEISSPFDLARSVLVVENTLCSKSSRMA